MADPLCQPSPSTTARFHSRSTNSWQILDNKHTPRSSVIGQASRSVPIIGTRHWLSSPPSTVRFCPYTRSSHAVTTSIVNTPNLHVFQTNDWSALKMTLSPSTPLTPNRRPVRAQ
ncbi:uncharacterized protein PHACADRAFT_200412 [Phanerochaete carnosa HHB-10118-sp]|uniref:Uncharacterized protein n=1 Tax=Phanerochaete carnosa (strain HHB-10118-sp) TaxID=650164 RepID=K5ULD5_PHACS|nr:uncharacterized protein PHACADRAFT_200412 [Phanerochaete carnosa HHB-10118-sp]EKM50466.1 hypothetical protein PHACADRAFT_200412 [Phanerochaete carnosa HHB-10118-sp]